MFIKTKALLCRSATDDQNLVGESQLDLYSNTNHIVAVVDITH